MAIRYLSGINVDSNTLFVDSTNNRVGIGTGAPSRSLTIKNSADGVNGISFHSYASDAEQAYIRFDQSDDTLRIGNVQNYATGGTIFYTNSTERLRITSAGNVGIGTTSPISKLQVNGQSRQLYSRAFIANPLDTDGYAGHIIVNSNNANGDLAGIGLYTNSSYSAAVGLFALQESSTAASMVFYTGSNLGAEKMRITSGGNVSIGTTANPGSRANVYISESGSTPNAILRLQNTGSAYQAKMIITDGYTNDAVIGYQGGYTSSTQYLGFGLGTTFTQMILTAAGNVGIGTTSPSVALHTNGFIRSANSGNTVYTEVQNDGLYATGTDLYLLAPSTKFISFYAGGAERMRISSAGALKLNAYGSGSNTGTATYGLAVDSSGNVIEVTSAIDGSGTANYVTKWQDSNTLTNSIIYDNGTNVGIGTTSPGQKLDVNGSVKVGTRLAMSPSTFGYSNSWKTLILGSSGTDYGTDAVTITFGVDLSSNPSGSYTGNGGEIFFRNQVSFGTPNAANTGYLYPMVFDNGTVYFPAGNVGIGTTSPSHKLDISSATARLVSNDSSYTAWFIANTGSGDSLVYYDAINGDFSGNDYGYVGQRNAGYMEYNIGTSSPAPYHVFTGGNVGIGTTSPQVELHIKGNNGWGEVRIEGQTFASGHGASLEFYSEGTALADIYASTDKHLYFRTNGTTERMRILANGNVGIGTTTPASPLQISAASVSSQGTLSVINTYASGNVYYPAARFVNQRGDHSFGIVSEFYTGATSGTDRPSILFNTGNSSNSWQVGMVTSGWGGNDSFGIGYRASNDPASFNTWPGTRLLITTGGNVLINTTTDNGSTLRVNGTIYADSTITSATSVRAVEGYFNPYTSAGTNAVPVYQDAIFLGPVDNDCTIQFGNEFFSTHGSYIRFRTNSASAQNTPVNVMTMFPNGKVALNQYGAGTFTGGTVAYNLGVDSAGNIMELPGGVVDGSGTANKVSKWSDSNTLTDANITDDGTTVRINSLPLMADSRLAIGTAGNDQNYASLFIGGNLTQGSSQYALLLDPQLDGTTNYGMLSNARIAANVTATTAYGIYQINNELLSGASIVNNFGIYIANQTSGTSQNWNLYSASGKNYFGGNVLIGTETDAGYKLRVNGTGRYDGNVQLYADSAGNSPRLIFGSETSSTDKSIFLESYYMVFQGHNNEGFKFQTTSSLGAVTNRMSILGTGTIQLSNYGSGSKTGTVAYNLAVDSSGNIIETPGGVVDGSGTANYVTKWTDANTIANSQIVDNGTNVGIDNSSPKTRLDINGTIGFGSKSMTLTDSFADALTVNMSNHTGCYVKITAFGDWSGHSAIAYLGEFFLQNGASAYNEPGIIIRQVDNTNTDDVQAQIVDPAGTGTRDFIIQLKTSVSAGTPVSVSLQYEVRGQYNSVS